MSMKEKEVETNLSEAPSLTPNSSSILKDAISYNCTECTSSIEILSIDENEDNIEFRCIKNQHHGKKIMPLKKYFENMTKYQTTTKNIEDKCEIHSKNKNNNYITFCFDCNRNLCKECLRSRIHINHNKNNIIEIQPIEEELNIIKEVIEYYKIKIEKLNIEKINKIKELKRTLKDLKLNEDNRAKNQIIENNNNKDLELLSNKNKYLLDLNELKKKYENDIKNRKHKFEKEQRTINTKYKLINEKENINHILNLEKLDKKYNTVIQNLKYDKLIENTDNILKINQIVYNTYNAYNDNYYNSININNILLCDCKNEYIKNTLMKKILKNKYEEILELILTKKKEDINTNIKKEKEEKNRKIVLDEKIELKIKEVNEENKLKIQEICSENEEKIKEIYSENEKKIKSEEKKLMEFLKKISIYFYNYKFN